MTEERKIKIRSWGISVFIHVVILGILGATGLLAMNKNDDIKDLADVVWIENAGGGSSGSGGSTSSAETTAAGISIETSVIIPQKEDREKVSEISNKVDSNVNFNSQAQYNISSVAGGSGADSNSKSSHGTGSGSGSGNGAGDGSGNGIGDGAGDGDGNGDGIGNGGGIGSSPSERAEAVCTHKATPKYPNRMKEQGIGGKVVLEIYVSPDDNIESVEVISSSGHGALDEAAINAAYRCRFAMNGLWGRYTLSYVFEVVDDDW